MCKTCGHDYWDHFADEMYGTDGEGNYEEWIITGPCTVDGCECKEYDD